MKSVLIFTLFFFNSLVSKSQTDTLRINIEDMVLTTRLYRHYLFEIEGHYSIPPQDKWTASDSALIENEDTAYFMIYKRGQLLLAGYKLPESHAIGEVRFYNSKSSLYKTEIWVNNYGLEYGDTFACWDDGPCWTIQKYFKKETLKKEIYREILHDEIQGFVSRTTILKYKKSKIIKRKIKEEPF
ncbi:MAG: hypothetical protein GC181_12945 [Bacteroidetes bacterium]|nr:hypothetical protein [Bacteroidota bacterium]